MRCGGGGAAAIHVRRDLPLSAPRCHPIASHFLGNQFSLVARLSASLGRAVTSRAIHTDAQPIDTPKYLFATKEDSANNDPLHKATMPPLLRVQCCQISSLFLLNAINFLTGRDQPRFRSSQLESDLEYTQYDRLFLVVFELTEVKVCKIAKSDNSARRLAVPKIEFLIQ